MYWSRKLPPQKSKKSIKTCGKPVENYPKSDKIKQNRMPFYMYIYIGDLIYLLYAAAKSLSRFVDKGLCGTDNINFEMGRGIARDTTIPYITNTNKYSGDFLIPS